MWEAIRSNRRRSMILISLMGAVLVLLGALIGLLIAAYVGSAPQDHRLLEAAPSLTDQLLDAQAGAYYGAAGALLVWFILWVTAVGAGDRILLSSARARQITKADAPQLWNVVEEMTIAAGLGRMPRVYIIDDPNLNAFAAGYRPQRAAVAVTSGLLKRLNRDELQGVIAHEIGHIQNLDVRFMTTAGVMLGAIVLIAHTFLRGLFYGGGRRRSSSRGGGQLQLVLLLVTILVAVLAPIAAQLLYFACSRRREFLADASSARFTRYPPGLASALEKISKRAGNDKEVNKVVAPMYIVNPLQGRALTSWFSTHPSTAERIQVLRGMAGAGFAAYEAAFREVRGAGQACVGQATLAEDEAVSVREPTPEPQTRQQAVERARQVGETLDRLISFLVIPCACGVKLKLPPDFKRTSLACPRCGRKHDVPRVEAEATQAANPGRPRYRRKGTGWESFLCRCGHPVQLSPKFSSSHVTCGKCGQRIEIVSASQEP